MHLWHPTNLDDWETLAGMVFVARELTFILKAFYWRYPAGVRQGMRLLDIELGIDDKFHEEGYNLSAVHQCLRNTDKFREVRPNRWVLVES